MATKHIRHLLTLHPWTQHPIVTLAPMRHISGPEAALAVSSAGGIGFMNPQINRESLFHDFQTATELLQKEYATLAARSPTHLPIGVGFVLWGVKLEDAVAAVQKFRPAIVWLYAGHDGRRELDEWSARLRAASEGTVVWQMIGTLQEVREANASPHAPDVLVVQGCEAGGHGRISDGSSWTTLLPEASDLVESSIPMFAAGGISDGRGVAAALSMGAAGVCMGTRFLGSEEVRVSNGYRQEVLRATDGAVSTTKTLIWNHMMGNYSWPKGLAPRGIINKTFTDQQEGVPFDELKKRFDEAKEGGDAAWGPDGRAATYAGTGVGLVRELKPAATIVKDARRQAISIIKALASEGVS